MVIEQYEYLRIANFKLLQTDFSFLGADNVLDSRNLLKKHLASFCLSNKTTAYGACLRENC